MVAAWRALEMPLDIRAPTSATIEQLALAHDERFLRAVLARKRPNGFGNRLRRVAESLQLTNGCTRRGRICTSTTHWAVG